jgi:(p)ppGpp synthase/HD superfamily hydrolase
MHDSVRRARAFALEAHGEQRYGAHPYHVHLDAVAALLEPWGERACIVGYLHDVIEDTRVEHADLVAHFGREVADCVALLTDVLDAEGRADKDATYARMADAGPELHLALLAKTADRFANVRASLEDGNARKLHKYVSQHAAFRDAAHRSGLCDALWAQLNAAIQEARAVLNHKGSQAG